MSTSSRTVDMLGRADIVSFSEALQLMQMHYPPPVSAEEKFPLAEACGRITSQEIRAPENLPAYPRATMDGFAVRAVDTFGASERLPAYLEVSGEVGMGEFPMAGPVPGACFRIATGGMLPPSTDAVVMLEHTISVDERMIEIVRPVATGGNVIAVGEDVQKGDAMLPAGHRLRPQDLGLLAGLGILAVPVTRRVKIGIISTGDEIVPIKETPMPGQVRDMNAVNLAALAGNAGAIPQNYGIVNDDAEHFLSLLQTVINENDLVVFSGSSSVGARDMGERVIEAFGPPGMVVHGVAIKPGKPVIIANIENKLVFGLPGHPVSAAMSFDLFVRPAIYHLAGLRETGLPEKRTITARLMRNVNSTAGRRDFIRVEIRAATDEGPFEAYPVLGKSGALSTMVKAHGYIIIDEKQQGLLQGETVGVLLFD